MDQKTEYEGLIEKILGLTRAEVQAITIGNTLANKATWKIKLYGAIDQWKDVLAKVLDLDHRIFRQMFFNETAPGVKIQLKRVNKYRDPVISIELSRKVKAPPAWEVKCLGCVGEEEKVLDICVAVNNTMRAHKFE